jgi:hypothetical protein
VLDNLVRDGGVVLIQLGESCIVLSQARPTEVFLGEPASVSEPEESSPDLSDAPWQAHEPDCGDQDVPRPPCDGIEEVEKQLSEEEGKRQYRRHCFIVEFGEAKWCLAQLAVLLLGVYEPFHEAFLMDKSNASTAFARVEQRLLLGRFSATYSTVVSSIFTASVSYR